MSTVAVGIAMAVICVTTATSVALAGTEVKGDRTEFDNLLKRHRRDISTQEGKAYEKAFMNQYEAKDGTGLDDCIQKSGQPTPFDMVLVTGEEGRATKAVARPRSLLTDCVIQAARKDAFSNRWLAAGDAERSADTDPVSEPTRGTGTDRREWSRPIRRASHRQRVCDDRGA